ncbi:MAG: ATP synthase F1 subunit epsilon [Oscillospiraceae bacterium]|nr:ATP synthase F1 subunit epsilon [Oscillospiraceae bacterium]
MEENKLETKKKVLLRVITPAEVKVDQEVDMVIMRATTGDMGVLPGHERQLCVLADGIVRLLNGRRERQIIVFGGLAEVTGSSVTILTDEAHWPGDIDKDRTAEAKEHLARKVQEQTDDRELLRDQLLLSRMMMKLDFSASPVADDFDDE